VKVKDIIKTPVRLVSDKHTTEYMFIWRMMK